MIVESNSSSGWRDDLAEVDRRDVDPSFDQSRETLITGRMMGLSAMGGDGNKTADDGVEDMIGGHAALVHCGEIKPVGGRPGDGLQGPLAYQGGLCQLAAVLVPAAVDVPGGQGSRRVGLDQRTGSIAWCRRAQSLVAPAMLQQRAPHGDRAKLVGRHGPATRRRGDARPGRCRGASGRTGPRCPAVHRALREPEPPQNARGQPSGASTPTASTWRAASTRRSSSATPSTSSPVHCLSEPGTRSTAPVVAARAAKSTPSTRIDEVSRNAPTSITGVVGSEA